MQCMISLYLCCARVRLSKHSLGNSYTRIRSAVIMNPGYAYNGEIVYCYFKIYRKYIKRHALSCWCETLREKKIYIMQIKQDQLWKCMLLMRVIILKNGFEQVILMYPRFQKYTRNEFVQLYGSHTVYHELIGS